MPATILVLEDDRANQEVLESILTSEGYQVRLAADGPAALAYLETARPDLIMLDLHLPQMSGGAFVEELQRRGLRPGLPVLILSAVSRTELAEQARQVHAEGFLAKPYELDDLLDEIARLVRG